MLVVVRRTVLAIRIKYECKIICINIIPSVKGKRRKVKSEIREYENKGAKKGCEMSDGLGGVTAAAAAAEVEVDAHSEERVPAGATIRKRMKIEKRGRITCWSKSLLAVARARGYYRYIRVD